MKKIFTLLVAVTMTVSIFGQTTIAEWAPNSTNCPGGVGNSGPSPFTATASDPNLSIGGLTRGSGITNPTGTSSGAASAWGGVGTTSPSATDAVTNNDFATFTVTANTGYKVSLTSIEKYNVRRSKTGSTKGQWQYKIGNGSFVNIGSEITWGNNTDKTGNEQSAIDLSTITDLQNVPAGTTVTFRVLAYGASDEGGTWYLVNGNDSATSKTLTIKGTVTTSSLEVSDISKTKNIFLKNTIVDNTLSFQTKGNATVRVYNTNGQLVKSDTISAQNANVNVANLPKGNYVVTAELNGETVSQKIVKQ
jgi:hypothetical protein